jgi:hypothetical protein
MINPDFMRMIAISKHLAELIQPYANFKTRNPKGSLSTFERNAKQLYDSLERMIQEFEAKQNEDMKSGITY